MDQCPLGRPDATAKYQGLCPFPYVYDAEDSWTWWSDMTLEQQQIYRAEIEGMLSP
jgi:hypothetical protein